MGPAEQTDADWAVLEDGAELFVSPLGPDDKELVRAGFERLSPQTRYRRFFAPLQRLSSRDLEYLTEIDHHDHEALAAIDPHDGNLVGVARYVRSGEPTEAEVSVVVADDWQRRGVATALLERLVERARAAGISHFIGLVLDENRDAIELYEHRVPNHARPRRSASGHLELLIDLPEPGRVAESTLGRVLRAVARNAVTVNPYGVMRNAIRRLRSD